MHTKYGSFRRCCLDIKGGLDGASNTQFALRDSRCDNPRCPSLTIKQTATHYTIAALTLSNLWETSRKEPRCGLDTRNDLEFTLSQSDGHTKPQLQTSAILPSVFLNSFCQKRAPIYCNLVMISKIFILVSTSFSGSAE